MFFFQGATLSRLAVILVFLTGFLFPALVDLPDASARSWSQNSKEKAPVKQKAAGKEKKAVKRDVQAKAAYCVNLASNRTLLAKNPDAQLPVASLTKLMTALVALDHMPLDKKIEVPELVRKIPKSVVGLKPGDRVSVKDLLHGLLMASGNDCAETLAGAFPGGREKFVAAMNKKARAMGVERTRFYTPSGLDHKDVRAGHEDKKSVDVKSNVSTAREIALIARQAFAHRAIKEISLKRHYTLASAVSANGYFVRNTNKLLRDNLPLEAGKTGYTVRAGHCLATKFHPGHNIFLIVVLGSPDHFKDTRLIYNKALRKAGGVDEKAHTRVSDTSKPRRHGLGG
ncbi:MAG: D-alanyl-D-alanine carboxypeptidase [Deltaproteobacteria bacterium]|nr:D-alanyl-D-alanine carboxypeptidase [Deltaproteobacteria bacterium]